MHGKPSLGLNWPFAAYSFRQRTSPWWLCKEEEKEARAIRLEMLMTDSIYLYVIYITYLVLWILCKKEPNNQTDFWCFPHFPKFSFYIFWMPLTCKVSLDKKKKKKCKEGYHPKNFKYRAVLSSFCDGENVLNLHHPIQLLHVDIQHWKCSLCDWGITCLI